MASSSQSNIVRTVRMNDGRVLRGTLKVADYVAFERKYNIDIPTSTNRIEYWSFLTWASLTRQGDIADDFDEFLKNIDEYVNDDDDEIEVPKDSDSSNVELLEP